MRICGRDGCGGAAAVDVCESGGCGAGVDGYDVLSIQGECERVDVCNLSCGVGFHGDWCFDDGCSCEECIEFPYGKREERTRERLE